MEDAGTNRDLFIKVNFLQKNFNTTSNFAYFEVMTKILSNMKVNCHGLPKPLPSVPQISYVLAQSLHPAIALWLSALIKKQCGKYYELFTVTDADVNKGELTPFIIGILEFTLAAAESAANDLGTRLEACRKKFSTLLLPELKNKTTYLLCDLLLQGSIFRFKA